LPAPSLPTLAPPAPPSGAGMDVIRLGDAGVNPSGLTNPTVPTAPSAIPSGIEGPGVLGTGVDGGSSVNSLYSSLRDIIGGGR
jgi:hypothetical protein